MFLFDVEVMDIGCVVNWEVTGGSSHGRKYVFFLCYLPAR